MARRRKSRSFALVFVALTLLVAAPASPVAESGSAGALPPPADEGTVPEAKSGGELCDLGACARAYSDGLVGGEPGGERRPEFAAILEVWELPQSEMAGGMQAAEGPASSGSVRTTASGGGAVTLLFLLLSSLGAVVVGWWWA